MMHGYANGALAVVAVSVAAAASIWLSRRRHRRRLAFTEAHVLAAMLHSGAISSAALLEIFLARGDSSRLNAVIVRDSARARARAAAADEAQRRGELWGPLHGLPLTVSEEMAVAGLPRCSDRADGTGRVGARTVLFLVP